jgi:hypothetical protein
MIEEIFLVSRLAALRGESRLTEDVLNVEGMSDARMRHLLNNIGGRVRTYVEVGCYHGSTLIAAAHGNPDLFALGIDNFSEDFPPWNTRGGPREQLGDNLRKYAPHAQFVEGDFRLLTVDQLPSIDCFFYDGAHDPQSQYEAILHFSPRFADESLLLFDDWNFDSVKDGTQAGVRDLRADWQVVCSAALCDTWNNVGVFVLRRFD